MSAPPGPGWPYGSTPGPPPYGAPQPPYGAYGTPLPPAAPRRNAPWLLIGGLVTGLALLAVGAGVGFVVGRGPAPEPEPEPVPVDPSVTLIGDERTADPCALLGDGALGRFGTPRRYPDFAPPASCHVEVQTAGPELLIVRSYLLDPAEVENLTGPAEPVGDLEIRRPAPLDDECSRLIVLPDDRGAQIRVARSGEGTSDLCSVADAAVPYAALVVGRGDPLPRRTLGSPTDAFAAPDWCTLLTAADVQPVVARPDAPAKTHFGDWGCEWEGTGTTGVTLTLERSVPSTEEADGTRSTIAGRDAYTTTDGFTEYCETRVALAGYTGTSGNPREDALSVRVNTGADPCGQAARLAGLAAGRLPA